MAPLITELKRIYEIPSLYAQYNSIAEKTRRSAIQQAADAWGLQYGGMIPQGNQFGETTIRIPFFNLGTTSGTAETWNRTLSATGWQTLIDKTIIEDVYLAIWGYILPNASQKIAALYTEGGDKKLPVINFQGHLQAFEQPIILFDQGIIVAEEKNFRLDVLVTSTGSNIIQPLGSAFAKSKILIAKKPV